MTRLSALLCALALGTLSIACSTSSSNPSDAGPGTDASGNSDAGVDGGVDDSILLVSGDWTLPPGTEDYQCVRVTIPEDMYVHEFIPVIPPGTHHTVLTIAPFDGTPDGQVSCNGFVNGPNMLYGSGVGTESLEFPEGIAVRITGGSQLLLNLHLYNPSSTETLHETSAIRVRTLAASEVVHEAEIVLAGKDEGLIIPPRQVTTQTGYCTFQHPQTVFSVFPHMHQVATHMTVTAMPAGGGEVTLLDTEYSFDDQTYRAVSPGVQLNVGDRVRVDCTYDNPTSSTIRFGESSEDEMCYAGIYRYPASYDTYVTCTL